MKQITILKIYSRVIIKKVTNNNKYLSNNLIIQTIKIDNQLTVSKHLRKMILHLNLAHELYLNN